MWVDRHKQVHSFQDFENALRSYSHERFSKWHLKAVSRNKYLETLFLSFDTEIDDAHTLIDISNLSQFHPSLSEKLRISVKIDWHFPHYSQNNRQSDIKSFCKLTTPSFLEIPFQLSQRWLAQLSYFASRRVMIALSSSHVISRLIEVTRYCVKLRDADNF